MKLTGLGLAPDDSCYDPQHPWWLPNLMHTAFECNCMVDQARPVDQLCVFAAPGGTPASYTAPSNVPGVLQIAAGTPGYLLGGVASSVAGGAAAGLGVPSWLIYVGVGLAAFVILKGKL